MKTKVFLCAFLCVFSVGFVFAQVPADQDTIVIEGGYTNAGLLETTINGDTTDTGARINPMRVYKLKANQIYFMYAGIIAYDTLGTVAIVGETGGKKPVILPTVTGEVGPTVLGKIYGSLTLKNLHIQTKRTDNYQIYAPFYMYTDNQKLTVEDCLVEYGQGQIFNLQGVTHGLDITFKNTYFRDMIHTGQWWACRVFYAKVPLDSVILENVTISNTGIGMIMQAQPIKYFYMNHCTFANCVKYPILAHYYEEAYITNNLFINCNWAGECYNIYGGGGQDPDAILSGVVGVDTLYDGLYESGNAPSMDQTKIFISDNIHYVEPIFDHYYNGEYNDSTDFPLSALGSLVPGKIRVENVPPIWMNDRTRNLINGYNNMIMQYNHENDIDPGLVTPCVANKQVLDSMVTWARILYKVAGSGEVYHLNWSFGDWDPTTIPGIETEDGTGITKIADLLEDFSYTANITSSIDGRKLGALHWIPTELTSWNSETERLAVEAAYQFAVTNGISNKPADMPSKISVSNAYPNPFNPSTSLDFQVYTKGNVTIEIYDLLGRNVKTLLNKEVVPGKYNIVWDATDADGLKVSSGIYFYRIKAGDSVKIKKISYLR